MNSVDLRGIRSPASATAATASTGVGLSSNATPPVRCAAATAAGTSCSKPTTSSVSCSCHSRSMSTRCAIVTSSARHAADRSAGSVDATRSGDGSVSSTHRSPSVTRNAAALSAAASAASADDGRHVLHAEAGRRPGDRVVQRQPRHEPVDRVHLRPVRAGVDQQRQPAVPRPGPGAGGVPVRLVPQVRRVAVVTVGDDRPPRQQVRGDRVQRRRVRERPDAVRHAVHDRRGQRRRRRPRLPPPATPRRRRSTPGRSAPGWPASPRSAPAGRPPGRPSCSRAAARPRPPAGSARPRRPARGCAASTLLHLVHVERRGRRPGPAHRTNATRRAATRPPAYALPG